MIAILERLLSVKQDDPVAFDAALVPINGLPTELLFGVVFVIILDGIHGLHPLRGKWGCLPVNKFLGLIFKGVFTA